MESLKDYSLNISEEEYHALPYWSHSMIARYAREGFSAIKTIHERISPTSAMEFGSLFDSVITKGIDATLAEYTIYDRQVPDSEAKVLAQMYKTTLKNNFKSCTFDDVIKAADDVGYQPRYRPETKYDKIKVWADYYDTIASGKKVISSKDWEDAMDMTFELRSNPYTGTLFQIESASPYIEYLYQLKFEVDITLDNGTETKIKFMPDLLIVNHKDKTIQPVDLKTSSMPAYDFAKNFIKYRYDIEAQLYSDGLTLVTDKIPAYKEYIILPYIFADISRSDKTPVAFVYNQHDISQINGLSYGDYNYKGWMRLLEEIIFYEQQEAKVPASISIDKPNDILTILNNNHVV